LEHIMDVIYAIAQFLVNEILSVPAYLIGIITAVGLIALRKSVGAVIGGGLKATLGFLLIGAGATLVTASLDPLGVMIQGALGAQGVVPTNEAIAGIAQAEYGAQVSWLMILGFVVALLLARFTPLRYVFLTGHHMLFMATMITIVMASAGMDTWLVVGLGAVLLGVLMVSLPALAQPWMKKVTGDSSIAIGHFGTAGYIAAGAVGRLVDPKGKSPSPEDIKVPEGLRFLRDSMVATALSMVLMYVIVAVIYLLRVGEETAFEAFGGATNVGNFLMQAVTQGLGFGIAVAVILFGVRTILGELVPAFQGIAAKVVPGAVPALDAPIVFPYAQNAVLIGFISSFVAGLAGLFLLGAWLGPALGLAVILPGLVPHFFTGGAAGVFGNATGGRRGAIAGGFVNGLLITFLPALLMQVLGSFGSAVTPTSAGSVFSSATARRAAPCSARSSSRSSASRFSSRRSSCRSAPLTAAGMRRPPARPVSRRSWRPRAVGRMRSLARAPRRASTPASPRRPAPRARPRSSTASSTSPSAPLRESRGVLGERVAHELGARGGDARVVRGEPRVVDVHLREPAQGVGGYLAAAPRALQPVVVTLGNGLRRGRAGLDARLELRIPGVVQRREFGAKLGLPSLAEPGPPVVAAVGGLVAPALAHLGVVLRVVKACEHVVRHNFLLIRDRGDGRIDRGDLAADARPLPREPLAQLDELLAVADVAVEHLADPREVDPEVAQREDALQPHERSLRVVAQAAVPHPVGWQQADVVVVAQGARRDAGGGDDLVR
jgi:PTS system ascorbate-specific IIC component